jgi:sulfur carrier protein ThiS
MTAKMVLGDQEYEVPAGITAKQALDEIGIP